MTNRNPLFAAVHESANWPVSDLGFCAAVRSTANLVRALTAARVYEYTP